MRSDEMPKLKALITKMFPNIFRVDGTQPMSGAVHFLCTVITFISIRYATYQKYKILQHIYYYYFNSTSKQADLNPASSKDLLRKTRWMYVLNQLVYPWHILFSALSIRQYLTVPQDMMSSMIVRFSLILLNFPKDNG